MSTCAEVCEWLHRHLGSLRTFSYPFDVAALPSNGIYFFYEKGEVCGHDSTKPRIVRVGTHRDGNFRSRIGDHFLLNERKMVFTREHPRPHDRSIFRCHVGAALLHKARDSYLSVWEMNLTTREKRDAYRHLRDIDKEVTIEREVTQMLRQNFSFKFIEIGDQMQRMGSQGLSQHLLERCQDVRSVPHQRAGLDVAHLRCKFVRADYG